MTTTRKSSRSHASAATANTTEPEAVSLNTTEQTDDLSFPSTVDSTHQASEAPHLKQDQRLEASDPDLVPSTAESLTADQLNDAASTPVEAEIQEEEGVCAESSSQAQDDKEGHKEPEHAEVATEDTGSTCPIPHAGDIEGQDDATSKTASVGDAALSHLDEAPQTDDQINQPHNDGVDATKHVKRHVEQDSNTVAEEEHDYVAGAYKSPFRHTHKAERAGKEER